MEEGRARRGDVGARAAFVRHAHDVFNEGDLGACLPNLTEDLEWHPAFGEALIGASTYRGHEGFSRYFEQVHEVIDNFIVAPEEVAIAGDYAVVEAAVSGRGRASGVDISTRMTIVWRFGDEGRFCWGATYFDRAEALAAVGLREEELEAVRDGRA